MLIGLLKHADRVRSACIAQLVNAIAPIQTVTGGGVWRQAIYFPFLHASRFGRGAALDVRLTSPVYETARYGPVPVLAATATLDEETDALTMFAVNRGQTDAVPLAGDLRCFTGYEVIEHLVLEHADPLARNTIDRPDEIVPHRRGDAAMQDGQLAAVLPRLSWNVIRLARATG
jgi:alpha-N-arabinofuranosidase